MLRDFFMSKNRKEKIIMTKKMTMNSNRGNKSFREAEREFIKHCRLKNLSENTLSYYEETLEVFIKYIGKNDIKLKDIDIIFVEDYLLYLKSLGIKSVSINTRLRGLRAFLYWCMKRGYMDEYKIKLIKQEEVIKETYTDEELKLLLKKPNMRKCAFTEYQNWVIVNFLIGTGVRLSTLVAIRIKDINLENSILKTVHNKNRKQQIIPVSRALNKVLMEYLEYRNHESDEDCLFCNQYGEKLTTDACRIAVSRFGQKRGVMHCGVHKFRHTFAKNWILSGGDVFRLQKILGHSSMDIVRKYVNIYGKDLQKDFDRFNVLDRLSDNKDYIKMR